jgi:hypothetical protein
MFDPQKWVAAKIELPSEINDHKIFNLQNWVAAKIERPSKLNDPQILMALKN